PLLPEINVTGNGDDIADGDGIPDRADHTDFGATTVGTPVVRTYTSETEGSASLLLVIPGAPAGLSLVAPAPPFHLLPSQSTTLPVQCDAAADGTYSGNVSIPNDDSDQNPYAFAVACQVDPLQPEINVTGNGVNIVDGDTTPALADHTDFGTTTVGVPVMRT